MPVGTSNEAAPLRSSGATMAGILGLVGGAYHLISGAAAIAEDDLTEAAGQILFDIDITVWGWFWVVVGAIQVVASILILLRNPVGRVLGIGIATVERVLHGLPHLRVPDLGTRRAGGRPLRDHAAGHHAGGMGALKRR